MKLHTFSFSIASIAAAIAGFISSPAFATIDVLPKEIAVDSNTSSVEIVNNGDRPEYVTISLSRLLNPGVPLDDEKLESVGTAAKPSLYAYPFKLSLAPGQSKKIVLKALQPVQNETVYRLDVKPGIKVLSQEQQNATGNIVVNFAFSALVRQLPESPREALSVTCDAHGARLTATGNIRYAVKDATVDGQAVPRFNVYPGVPRSLHGRVVEIPGYPACRGDTAVPDAKASRVDGLPPSLPSTSSN
ncbi:hypothetical protein [Burkholderia ambifaria]|uniref:Pili assembly chaperone N-terminal domain-containing protein n=1 Tax=Burkholderia ambifaria MEX-5 TaxID=396597 RepID=B1TCU2_9BURK|nr:hypothetical protein [Burkholderia ambifaria]EDT38621.1 conserved hypothetical protein [Burkholderia ambifaria MEX-5]